MAVNELKTIFIFDNFQGEKNINSSKNSLVSLNNDVNSLGKRSDDLRKSFQSIASQRLNNGQVNNLTKEIVFASENARRLNVNIKAIKTELASPNRNSSIDELTKDLRNAEKEADALARKLNNLQGGGVIGRSSAKTSRRRQARLR